MENFEKIILTRVDSVFTVVNTSFNNRQKTNRKTHALCFCLSGKTVYEHNGNVYASDREHAILIPQGATYLHSCTEEGHFPLINFYTTAEFAPSEFMVFEIDSPDDYMEDFRELEKISLLHPKNEHLKSMHILYSILLRLHKGELAKESRTFHIIRPAVQYLENHFSDPQLTNSILAEQAMISEVYFRRIFKENFGVSPKQYIRDLQIAKAKNLLIGHKNLSVAQIAEEIGFSNIYQFSAAFKKATGLTPTAYSKRAQSTDT